MKLKKNNIKGFTLVELLVVLGLGSIILTMVFSFFMNNLKSFDRSEDELDLQYNSQYAMDYITEIANQAKGISYIESIDYTNMTASNEAVSINQITFVVEYSDESTGNVSFSIDSSQNQLNSSDSVNSIANYIEEIIVTPWNNESFNQTSGVILRIKLTKRGSDKLIESQINFRNHD